MDKIKIKSSKNNILEGLLMLEPNLIRDNRGFFFESWNEYKFNNIINEKINFVQDNHAYSFKNVIRGLHYQLEPFEQGKLISCSKGIIFDVAVDIRSNSPTFKEWGSVILDSERHNQLWIPKGFAHGYQVLSEFAHVNYKVTNYWSKEHESSIKWNDPEIGIEWPISKEPILSKKDLH